MRGGFAADGAMFDLLALELGRPAAHEREQLALR